MVTNEDNSGNILVPALRFQHIPVERWRTFQPEKAIGESEGCQGVEFLRKQGCSVVYRKTSEGYACSGCEQVVMKATVAHPIHDGPFDGAGSGRCFYEEVPYCRNCEEKPELNGDFIRTEMVTERLIGLLTSGQQIESLYHTSDEHNPPAH